MPRIARLVADDLVFHILTRGNNRNVVFLDEMDYRHYLSLLALYREEHSFLLYHYCLMPNHIHMILKVTKDTNLAKLMKQINISYVYHFKKKYSYYGHFWQDRYKSLIIDKDEYLLMCGKYIELNPVKAGLVNDPKDYPYSSYNFYVNDVRSAILHKNPLYEDMANTDKERQAYYKDLIIETNKINLNRRFLGSKYFINMMEHQFGITNRQRRRGRPRNEEK